MSKEIVHRRALRVGAADDDVLFLLAQIGRNAGERAAGADRADESVDAAIGLCPDLGPGRKVVRPAVIEIVPLIGKQHTVLLAAALAELVGKPAADVLVVVR